MIKRLMQNVFGSFFIIAIVLFFGNCEVLAQTREQLGQMIVLAQNASGDRFSFETKTSGGARVYAVNKPSAQMLTAIDRGLTDLFAVARKNKLKKRLSYADYTVFIARADRTKDVDGKYSPDFAVGAAQYAGTEYDKVRLCLRGGNGRRV